ncbi:MAG: RNA polymerase sigma factor [Verrucomicrobia bacterium]|nr:RNA polymerase sigma factor [Verrucomicrobiota bacterium]
MSTSARDFTNCDDAALVTAVQAGDADAFEPLLDRHLAHVRTFVALRAPVPQLVDEIAHDAFVFAFRNLGQFAAGTSFQAWLRAIAWNLLRAEVQRFSREQANQSRYAEVREWEAVVRAPSPAADARELESLEECLGKVPAPMRELLTLKYREELPSDEIATRLKRSTAWVRTVLFRVRQELKECIEQNLSRPC